MQTNAQTLHLAGRLAAVGIRVPESVKQLIAQHVGQLSPPEQALLEAASVAGMTFSTAAVAAGVPPGGSDIETQLTSWVRQGRFVQAHGMETWPDGTVSARYAFRHALYHEVILGRISPGRCIRLHQLIGTRKEKAYTGQTEVIAAELAVHFEAAQDFHQAVLYRQHAAENALQRSAYEEAIAHLTRGLELLEALPDTSERAQHELILRLTLGTPPQARGQEALTLARELSHPFSEAFILGHLAVLHQFARNGRETCEWAQELVTFCTEKGYTQWMEMGIILQGWGLAIQGHVDTGIAQMRQGLACSGAAGTGLGQSPVMTQLAEACWMAGRIDEGLAALEQALTAMDATGEYWWAAETYRLYGELLQMAEYGVRDTELTPEACFHRALDIARAQQAKSLELRAAISLARLWQQQDKRRKAFDLLTPVYEWFTEGFDTADLRAARALFNELGAG